LDAAAGAGAGLAAGAVRSVRQKTATINSCI
jgi:hypothetical protein